MDLDRCPRCGNAWSGQDRCAGCGFVPRGAEIDPSAKDKKPPRVRAFLSLALLGLCGWGLYLEQPWQDDWESVRALIGRSWHHRLTGDWEIEKILTLGKSNAAIDADAGLLRFEADGRLEFDLRRGAKEFRLAGGYAVAGERLALTGVHPTSGNPSVLPASLALDLAWTGADAFIATCGGSEALYLRRDSNGNPPARLLHMRVRE